MNLLWRLRKGEFKDEILKNLRRKFQNKMDHKHTEGSHKPKIVTTFLSSLVHAAFLEIFLFKQF